MANTPILGIPQVAPNQNNKETTINDGFSIIERSLNQSLPVDMAAGSVTLTSEDFRHNLLFDCLNHVAARTLTVPNQVRFFGVRNSGTAIVTVGTAAPVSTVDIPIGSFVILYLDGANKALKIADSAASSLAPTFVGLTDTPANYTGAANQVARVNSAGDGMIFSPFAMAFNELTDVPAYISGYYARIKADGTGVEFVAANPGGETQFTLLNDTPANYTGAAGFMLRVNAAGTGVEFVASNSILAFLGLTDTPADYTGAAGQLIAVNVTGNGLEFVPYPSAGQVVTRTIPMDNTGFEAGTLEGWTVTVGNDSEHAAMASYGTLAGPSEGSFFYAVVSDVSTAGQLDDTYDLTQIASNNELDNDAQVDVTFDYASLNVNSTGRIRIEALSSLGAVLGTREVGPLSTATVAWASGLITYTLPVGTRSINIILLSDTTGAVLEFAWDNLRPILTVTETNSFILLPDTPDTYVGQAGKFSRVKQDETGLEFFGLVFRLTDMTDTPANLQGQAGRILAVNVGETAFEFVDPLLEHTHLAGTISYIGNRTLVAGDAEQYLRCTDAANTALTVPPNANVPFPLNTMVHHRTAGAGKVTLTAGVGVTLNPPFGQTLVTPGAGATISMKQVAIDEWDIIGHTEAVT